MNWFTSTTKTYLTPSWIRDLFTFCDSHNIQLLDNCAKLPLRTTNDRFIMQILQCHYSGNDLRKLHQCREFLQVLTISDICTADGCSLDNSMLSGRSTLRPRSRLQWPNQPPQLSPQHWSIWNQALRTHLLQTNRQTLRQPIGLWHNLADWKWTYSPSENRIYQTTGLHYTYWTAIPSRTRHQRFNIGYRCSQRPNDVIPATVSIRNPDHLILTGLGNLLPSNQPNPQSLSEHIRALPPSDQWASIRIEITDDGTDLAHGITLGTATAISDGSYKDNYGTSCSILRGPN